MKKSSLLVAVFALTTVFGGLVSAQAATCTDTNNLSSSRTASDPFGSCEDYKSSPAGNQGNVKCGSGQDVAGVFTLIVKQSGGTGVQGCSGRGDLLPIGGRVSVYADTANNVAVSADGSDSENSGGASAWQRYDVRPTEQAVCARRGDSGTWWTGANGGKGTSTANSYNQGINPSLNRAPCGGSATPA